MPADLNRLPYERKKQQKKSNKLIEVERRCTRCFSGYSHHDHDQVDCHTTSHTETTHWGIQCRFRGREAAKKEILIRKLVWLLMGPAIAALPRWHEIILAQLLGAAHA
ncbi:hypothetical protein BaRGS_00012638 [Batillaria attramentaria]|uniref:C2H2-type domain-containing protein n=1 Tax=Batillaria attramentaria TaxID=370345 RepID=A0ABD0LAH6_9CAEN